jgi:hypothetical protein
MVRQHQVSGRRDAAPAERLSMRCVRNAGMSITRCEAAGKWIGGLLSWLPLPHDQRPRFFSQIANMISR